MNYLINLLILFTLLVSKINILIKLIVCFGFGFSIGPLMWIILPEISSIKGVAFGHFCGFIFTGIVL